MQGLPPGLSYECNGSCVFLGNSYNCASITGTPTSAGVYPLNIVLDVVAEYEVFGIMVPIEITDDTMLNGVYTLVINNCAIGCTDDLACNYDPNATEDDGSCDYIDNPSIDMTATEWTLEYDWECNNDIQVTSLSFNLDGTAIEEINNGFCNWSMCGDTLIMQFTGGGAIYTGTYSNGLITGTMIVNNLSGCFTLTPVYSVSGCTDIEACNYDDNADFDDGSCVYPDPGCDCDDNCDEEFSIASLWDGSGTGEDCKGGLDLGGS